MANYEVTTWQWSKVQLPFRVPKSNIVGGEKGDIALAKVRNMQDYDACGDNSDLCLTCLKSHHRNIKKITNVTFVIMF